MRTPLTIALILTLAGCDGSGSYSQPSYKSTVTVDSVHYSEKEKSSTTMFMSVGGASAGTASIGRPDGVYFPMEMDFVKPQKLTVAMHCKTHGWFELVVEGDSADSLREKVSVGSAYSTTCTPYQKFGWGTQIRHDVSFGP